MRQQWVQGRWASHRLSNATKQASTHTRHGTLTQPPHWLPPACLCGKSGTPASSQSSGLSAHDPVAVMVQNKQKTIQGEAARIWVHSASHHCHIPTPVSMGPALFIRTINTAFLYNYQHTVRSYLYSTAVFQHQTGLQQRLTQFSFHLNACVCVLKYGIGDINNQDILSFFCCWSFKTSPPSPTTLIIPSYK